MSLDTESAVLDRYTAGAQEKQESLCCPIEYDSNLLAILPQEIIERDYGCGDPSRYVQEGDVVLDLGSGGGKVCYMAAQLVGATGRVIGIDMNDDMLALACKYQSAIAARLGGDRVAFLKGRIQDLATDVAALQDWKDRNPVITAADQALLEQRELEQKQQQPLIADVSIDLVISNCVLNLVADSEKQQMIAELYRVLKPGGRLAIADIISDQPVPLAMKEDSDLWSGCISGAFHETEMPAIFAAAGFTAVSYDKWDSQPWQVVDGIAFRSVTLTAHKPVDEDAAGKRCALIYRGPFDSATDEAGNVYQRGERILVSSARHRLLTGPAYQGAFIDAEPQTAADGCSSGPTSGSCCG